MFSSLDGQQALESVAQHQPDLVISDIVMPVMDGYVLCRNLKADAVASHTPVILLTALTDPTDIVRGLQAGADYYLTKPFSPDYHRLENHARVSDLAARYGGEEFALLLPNTNQSTSLQVAERLRETICAMPWPRRTITISIGIATFFSADLSADDLTVLFARADAALYASKNAGRNRSTHADDLADLAGKEMG